MAVKLIGAGLATCHPPCAAIGVGLVMRMGHLESDLTLVYCKDRCCLLTLEVVTVAITRITTTEIQLVFPWLSLGSRSELYLQSHPP